MVARSSWIELTTLHEGVFISDVILDDGARISARPSDAVAIGLRAGAPVEVDEAVLVVALADIDVAGDRDGQDVEQEIAEFRDRRR